MLKENNELQKYMNNVIKFLNSFKTQNSMLLLVYDSLTYIMHI